MDRYEYIVTSASSARSAFASRSSDNSRVRALLLEAGAFWFAGEDASSPDLQLHVGRGSGIEKGFASLDSGGVTLNDASGRSRSRGWVHLASADPREAPLVDPSYSVSIMMGEKASELLRGGRAPGNA